MSPDAADHLAASEPLAEPSPWEALAAASPLESGTADPAPPVAPDAATDAATLEASAPDAVPSAPDGTAAPPSLAEPPTPAAAHLVTRDAIESALRDNPELRTWWQSETDRRAAAQAAAWQREQQAAAAQEAAAAAAQARQQADYDLARRAAEGDYDAQTELAQQTYRELNERQTYQQWQTQHGGLVAAQHAADLARQYREALPAVVGTEVAATVDPAQFPDVKSWLTATRAALYEQWRKTELQPEAERLAEVLVSERLAQARTTQRNPDISQVPAPEGRPTGMPRTQVEAEARYLAGRRGEGPAVSGAQLRAWRNSLPYDTGALAGSPG